MLRIISISCFRIHANKNPNSSKWSKSFWKPPDGCRCFEIFEICSDSSEDTWHNFVMPLEICIGLTVSKRHLRKLCYISHISWKGQQTVLSSINIVIWSNRTNRFLSKFISGLRPLKPGPQSLQSSVGFSCLPTSFQINAVCSTDSKIEKLRASSCPMILTMWQNMKRHKWFGGVPSSGRHAAHLCKQNISPYTM